MDAAPAPTVPFAHEVAVTSVGSSSVSTQRRVGLGSSLGPRRVGPFFLFSVLQLGTQIARSEYKPPFTLAVMAAQTLSYLRPGWLRMFLRVGRPISDVYMLPAAIMESLSPLTAFRRMILSAAIHADHYHLYYNSATWLWQGTQLESRMGSKAFAKLVGTLLCTSHAIFVVFSWFLSWFGLDGPYYSISLGFSNVLFALKMVMCYELPGGVAHIFGYAVRMQTEMWFELLINWLLLPQTSVTAHLSGIVAGYLYYEWATLRPLDASRQAVRSVVGSLPRWITRPLGLDQVFNPLSPAQQAMYGGGARLGGGGGGRGRARRGGPRWSPTRPLHNPLAQDGQQQQGQQQQGPGGGGGGLQRYTAGAASLLAVAQGRLLNLIVSFALLLPHALPVACLIIPLC